MVRNGAAARREATQRAVEDEMLGFATAMVLMARDVVPLPSPEVNYHAWAKKHTPRALWRAMMRKVTGMTPDERAEVIQLFHEQEQPVAQPT